MKKIRLIGIKEASIAEGVFNRGDIVELPDEKADSYLTQTQMWELVAEENTEGQPKKSK